MRLEPTWSALCAAAVALRLLPVALAVGSDPAHTHFTRDYDAHDYYAVHLASGVSPLDLSDHLGIQYVGPLGELEDHHVFFADKKHAEHDVVQIARTRLKARRRKRDAEALLPHILDNVLLSQKQLLHKRFPLVKRRALPLIHDERQTIEEDDQGLVQQHKDIAQQLDINDPIFLEQWHLFNSRQPGHDLNVTGVWLEGITGKNSTTCIVDDGLDFDSDDLRDNYFAAGSYDFNDKGPDPKPRLVDDRHGTRCAGEVAAVRNDACGVGMAYDGKVAGIRILSKVISDADEAIALNYGFQDTQIYSCSWGPPDDGVAMDAPGVLIRRAMLNGIQKGRGGKGSIFVFAIGNGAANDDNCNFDGYTNSIYSVSVGGIDRKGKRPYYSEACSAQLVVTYSSGSGDAIHTTDVGKTSCYTQHGGTSAAGPLVAGVYALMMEVNPDLTWRDIQWLTVLTAVKIDEPGDWKMNEAVGKEFSHEFGYGKADTWALVQEAKTWVNVKPQAWYFGPWLHVRHDIPQGDQGLASSFDITDDMLEEANLERIEHVTVTMNIKHARRGDLSVELHSPSGMISHIATARRHDNHNTGYRDWTFMSVAHWGEKGVGKWTVVVKDTNVNKFTGHFTDWRIKFWGESIDADKATLLPMPNDDDDKDHDSDAPIPTVTAPAVTTSVTIPPSATGSPEGNPEDHHDRPVNVKPPVSTPSKPSSETSPSPSAVSPSPSATSTAQHFLPHIFPTFGVSPTTQIWIYGASALILIFLACLGGWAYHMRRKKNQWMRARSGSGGAPHEDYEFEVVAGHDDEDAYGSADERDVNGGNGALNGKKRNGKNKARAGELYDAFAPVGSSDEGSSDEDDGHEQKGKQQQRRDIDDEEVFDIGEDSEDDDDDAAHTKDAGSGRRYRD